MPRIKLNHLFVSGNELSISVMRYFITISIETKNNNNYCVVKIMDNANNYIVLDFDTLEESISFIEEMEKYNISGLDIIFDKYQEKYRNYDSNKIVLSALDVKAAIANYYGDNKNNKLTADYNVYADNDDINISFYIIEQIDYNGVVHEHKTMLTRGDLKNVFSHYLEMFNFDLEDFKYIGGIHRAGYYFDKHTPHFDGIELSVKRKNKTLERRCK